MTGPMPPPKRFLHIVRFKAFSFIWKYPLPSLRSSSNFLRLLPLLLVTSISPFIFPSITCRIRQFLRSMWPIQLAFRFRISRRIFLCSLTLSNTSSFLTWSVSYPKTVALIKTKKTLQLCWRCIFNIIVLITQRDYLYSKNFGMFVCNCKGSTTQFTSIMISIPVATSFLWGFKYSRVDFSFNAFPGSGNWTFAISCTLMLKLILNTLIKTCCIRPCQCKCGLHKYFRVAEEWTHAARSQ